jgi:hypothetical protein
MTKYFNRQTEYNGQVFDSAAEARRAQELDLLKAAGQIGDWIRPSPMTIWQHGQERITYTPDFCVWSADLTRIWYEDVTGGRATQTEAFRMKAKMFRGLGHELRILETRR